MRLDAVVPVVCDGCDEEQTWEPPFVYADLSGRAGHYDTSNQAFAKWLEGEGWIEVGDKTYCKDCTPDHQPTPAL